MRSVVDRNVVMRHTTVYGKLLYSITSSCHHEADENCALLGYHAASGGKSLSTFRHNLSGPTFKSQDS